MGMATAQQLKALLQSYSEADGEMFVSVALQIAAHEARAGKGKLATEIKRLVDEIKGKQRSAKVGGSVPIARPTGEPYGHPLPTINTNQDASEKPLRRSPAFASLSRLTPASRASR